MDKFLETYNLPIQNEEEIESVNRPVITNENVEKKTQKTYNKQNF